MSHLIGTSEAARRLGVNRSTVKRWATEGRLPISAEGDGQYGPRLFDAEDVNQLAAERAPAPVVTVPVRPRTRAERMAWLEANQ